MNCRICGCPLEEGAMFCTNCGAKVDQNESAFSDAQASAPWQNGGQAYAMPPQAPPVSASPLWQGVRKTLGSKVFLVTAILATVSLGLELIGSFSVRGNEFGNTASVNFGWVLTLLFVVGVWLLRSSGRSPEPLRGLGLIRGVSIFMIVTQSLALGILCLALIPVLPVLLSDNIGNDPAYNEIIQQIGGSFLTEYAVLGVAGVVLLFLLIVLSGLIYFVKISALAKTIREIDETGMQSRPISSYLNFYHIFNIVLALIGMALNLLFSQKAESYLSQMGIETEGISLISSLSSLLSIALNIALFFTIRALKQNLHQGTGREGYTEP